MKKFLLSVLVVLLCATAFKSKAQNLVMNPGFDGFITCPGFGQFNSSFIIAWDKPSIASSDYYHYNCAGIQPAAQSPRSGEGYAGIICYNFGTEYREYVTGTFSAPLTAGTLYDVEFYVSLNDGYIQAIEEVGAYISTAAPGPFSNVLHISVIPQIENTSGALSDTANWKRVFGQYLAIGGEQFITIGNFHDDTTTTITQPGTSGSYGAYYFIDDVSVVADSTTSISEVKNNFPEMYVTTNGEIHVKWETTNSIKFPVTMTCFNSEGKKIFEEELSEPIQVLRMKTPASGFHLFTMTDADENSFVKKMILQDR